MDEERGNVTSIQLSGSKVDIATSSSSSNSSSNFEVSDTNRSVYSTCVSVVDLVNHALIVALTIFTLYHALESTGTFNLHITLCTIGYVLLMSEAIVVLAGESFSTRFLTHRAKRHLHWILQILGVVCIIAGVLLMYRAKDFYSSPHFSSTHGILGIISVAVLIFLSVFGYPVYIAAKLRNVIRPVVIKFGHNFLGTFCFAIGMASQCYGYKKFRALDFSPNVDVKLICIIITAVITVLSVRKALPDLFRQFVTLFK